MDTLEIFGTEYTNVAGFKATDNNGNIKTYTRPATPAPTPWVRPSDWPDLSKMDVSGGDILYMTSYADEARGFCSFYCNCTGDYTVEVGTISGTTFTAESTQSFAGNTYCYLYYGSSNGTYKVLRVTGTAITKLTFNSGSAVTIGAFCGYSNNQGVIDIVGKLPYDTGLSFPSQYNLVNVEIDGLTLSGSSSVSFNNCCSLVSVDVSNWDTGEATGMSTMFQNCYSLTSLDVSGWDTGKVTSMSSMFAGCYSLTSLDVSGWNTGKVTNMASMFSSCNSLISLDVSGWDTGNVTSMSNMFYGCASLTSLDVSEWDTGEVTNTSYMFYNCTSLSSLDVSKWDTGKLKTPSYMFQTCHSITSLDVSGWYTGAVTNMSYMFASCYSLTSLDVSEWDTGAVANMGGMFSSCYSLTSLDVSEWDTGAVTSMANMFYNCYSLTTLDVSGWDTGAVTNMSSMFGACYSLTSLDVSEWDFSLVTTSANSGAIFRYCRGLHGSITLPSTVTQIGTNCFGDTRSLKEYHFKSTTPPTLASTNAFDNMTDFGGKIIYVPSASLSAYQSAQNWSTYASYMVGE